ncbi:MAG: glycoside hydrolase family 97 catalytic domain-containing protein [Paludibacter sp.]
MKKTFLTITSCCLLALTTQAAPKKLTLNSPDGKLSIEASVNSNGAPVYTVRNNNQPVILHSALGLVSDQGDFSRNVRLSKVIPGKQITETYYAPAEKRSTRTYTANYASLTLANASKKTLTIEFKATNEGVAFRYLQIAKSPIAVKEEKTSFKFATSAKAWLHPHADAETGWCGSQPSYEEQYEYDIPVGTAAPLKAGWSFPALFKTEKNWVLITEAGLTPDYVGTRLAQQSPNGEYSIGFPQKGETVGDNDPTYPVSANITSPWRVIVVGSLATVVESQLVTDLAKPADKATDYSWVKTGISSWSWGVMGDNATVYPVQKEFIDYASDMKWDYCLINADWDWKIGYDKIKELADYAKTKNVGVILWYNSSGDWNTTKYTPKGALVQREARRKEFQRIHEMGIAGVKVDFWPGDGQSAIQLYHDMLKDAADFHLLVNFHGTTVPRGWSRTYPNLVAMEAIRGFEFTTFDQKDTDLAPKHLTMMPYARNVVGPMDFTPVCFGEIRGKQRRTSNAFEMALTVILQSGVQHYVEIPESMAKQPDFVKGYMQTVPRKWDDIKLIDGFPGKYVVMARKAGNKWYLAGINSQNETQKITLDLSALKIGSKSVTIITNGDTNRSFIQQPVTISNDKLEVEITPNGGFTAVL